MEQNTPQTAPVTKTPELQMIEAKAAAEFAVTPAGQMLRVFETTQRIGKMLASSTIIPESYQGNVSNCAIAADMAMHLGNGISALTVMQNLVIVGGRPTWSAAFLISCINSCGRFAPLRYREENLGKIGKGAKVNKYVWDDVKRKGSQKIVTTDEYADVDNLACTAYTYDKTTGEEIIGTTITIKMAMAEGWFAKNNSKWASMPQQMLRYRAAAFWQRAYAPEIGMGFHTTEEMRDATIQDAVYEEITDTKPAQKKTLDQLAIEAAATKAAKKPHTAAKPETEPAAPAEPETTDTAAKTAETENPKAERTLL